MDPITRESLDEHLSTRTLGRVHHAFGSVESTNDVARRIARGGAPHGTLVTAEQQTAGRGRRGRKWVSPLGLGIWCSLVVRGEFAETGRATGLGLVAASAAVDAIRSQGVWHAGVKWPNDVVAVPNSEAEETARPAIEWPDTWMRRARKVAGILVERVGESEACVIVGIGLNIHHRESDFPPEIASTASSVGICAGRPVSRSQLLAALLLAMETRLALPPNGLQTEWQRGSVTLGRRVEISTPDRVFEARAMRVEQNGGLTVNTPSGETTTVTGGETTVRWAGS